LDGKADESVSNELELFEFLEQDYQENPPPPDRPDPQRSELKDLLVGLLGWLIILGANGLLLYGLGLVVWKLLT
jgi:hypothetical protein